MYEVEEMDVFRELEELKHSDTPAEHRQFMERVVNGEDIQCTNCNEWFNEKVRHRCNPRLTVEQGSRTQTFDQDEEAIAEQVSCQVDIFVNGMHAATVAKSEASAWEQSYKKAVPKAKITIKPVASLA
ncbi:MAG: hypothetical protein JRN21_09705 [Nitrososphaerota archaeon]|nr:hypothetical protein [Nitrososphaerota archaeon]